MTQSNLLNVYDRLDVSFIDGSGMYLFDKDRNKYLDFASGIATNNLGYNNVYIVKALTDQANLLWHTSNLYKSEIGEEVAQKLANVVGLEKVFFCNSGTESIETAIKIVRKYFHDKQPQKKHIITLKKGFHGRTIAAISAGGNPKYQEGYSPLLPGFVNVDIENTKNLSTLENSINQNTAAILLEPIRGEGGIMDIGVNYLKSIKNMCDRYKILLVLDEVQCGSGRSGKFCYFHHTDIKPDIVTLAKGLGCGFPVGACLVSDEVAKCMVPGTHGGTYGGNPLAMSVVNVVLEQVNNPDFLEHVTEMGQKLKYELTILKNKYNFIIDETRGLGLMLGLKLKKTQYQKIFIKKALENKLLIAGCGKDYLRIIPPLIINEEHIKEGVEKLDQILSQPVKLEAIEENN